MDKFISIKKRNNNKKNQNKIYLVILLGICLIILPIYVNKIIKLFIPSISYFDTFIVVLVLIILLSGDVIMEIITNKIPQFISNVIYQKRSKKYINYNNIKYFREKFSYIDINILSYLVDMLTDNRSDLVAGVLKLEQKKFLSIKNNTIEFLDNDIDLLTDNELFLLISLKNKRINDELDEWQVGIMADAYKYGLITESDEAKKMYKYSFLSLLILSLIAILGITLKNNFDIELIVNIYSNKYFICTLFFIFLIVVFYISKLSESPYKRTKLGNELTARLYGMKNYIKDFSILDQRKKDEIILWDDYLIYACLFSLNKKVNNKTLKIIDEYISK